ncbi:I78 family peptidase inhibitor [Yoonia vestfoldensis]|uniref:I78 family peptidase inhibitor n=1 Tax=Yoonia vestfoldensis TaxID=245188 RepID=UPI00039B47FF|nr:I78 family peptidase inhibitor [Yoonia vestfoldensis]
MRYLIPLVVLAACATVDDTTSAPSLPDTCGAGAYTYLVGQPATALERVLIMDVVRLVRPDTIVTMDYRPERINFMISDQEIIADITCG